MIDVTKMAAKNEDNLMVNTRLMKLTGLYHLLDSRSPKIFGHYALKCMSLVQMSILLLLTVIFTANKHTQKWSNEVQIVLYTNYFFVDVSRVILGNGSFVCHKLFFRSKGRKQDLPLPL
ncbi:odorant receptor 46a-like [Aphis craccivora]|uniref:Odorant receptor 46a-like n=1 Tax=Aphis craccivora TaxID=307492 RepID=A0A6G0YN81_APHCR|nr:odorant receptor 46a-like [Aphis craccivora]